ncbi:Receptor-like protein 4 [Citrus sinensis]|uniref:receptor-like protein 4 n=1 Tax=Citrus sinensis TaxID=2711 RepID=UPI0003D6F823|nr:receptor-like protein 4 [Citrus sinensis]KAH9748789.1 Receptor-like protein 4 [Citrus sinensis]
MLRFHFLWLLVFCSALNSSSARHAPFAMRISCGARQNIHSPPTNTLWFKDFAYTGGIPANATRPSFITPPLKTLRYFPLSEGPENCYIINRVPKGHYNVRIFFGLVTLTSFDHEPLFDISVEGTQIYSLKSGWSDHDDRAFAEALVFLRDGTVSICFHSTGHGDPAILSLEILQVDDKAYYFGQGWGEGLILRTATRLSCGNGKPKFDVDYSGDHWGGDRFWNPILSFGQNADQRRSTESSIKQASKAPNFYPEALYQTALVSTDSQPDLQYTMDVDPNRNYSIWLHFAEIDNTITGVGQRVFDILINGDIAFEGVDVVKMSGDRYTALVLNTTVAVNGRTLTVTLHPKGGSHAIINAIEVFEIIAVESKTLPEEVRALQVLKNSLDLPHRFGWNGDPCVPQQHPWSGADCQFDRTSHKWVIDGLGLDNQGLRGFLPNGISKLRHLQSINLSGNSIRGAIPSSLGTIASLEVLDLSYNFFNGSIPESLGQLTALRRLNLNGNSLSGRVPAALGGRLLHRASFNFTDNAGLCGIPGLRACGPHLSTSAKIGIGFGVLGLIFLLIICSMVWWKRRQNILRAQQIAARGAPYAKARTHLSHDIQLARHYNHHGNARTAAENGPSLLS